jgi:hypothetical protein
VDKEQVLSKLASAFEQELFPGDAQLYISSASHIFDVEDATENLSFEHWNHIPLENLNKNRDRISYLTEVGFRFLLPAFLTAAIMYPREVDIMVDNIIFALTPPDSSEEYHYDSFMKRARLLSALQIEAILAFFESYAEIYPVDEWSFSAKDYERNQRAIQFWGSLLSC